MYLLASLYETPQMAMTASFAYAHYRFLGEESLKVSSDNTTTTLVLFSRERWKIFDLSRAWSKAV